MVDREDGDCDLEYPLPPEPPPPSRAMFNHDPTHNFMMMDQLFDARIRYNIALVLAEVRRNKKAHHSEHERLNRKLEPLFARLREEQDEEKFREGQLSLWRTLWKNRKAVVAILASVFLGSGLADLAIHILFNK